MSPFTWLYAFDACTEECDPKTYMGASICVPDLRTC